MRRMRLDWTSGSCDMMLGEPLARLESYCEKRNTAVVTDSNIMRLHGEKLSGYNIIVTEPGEGNKTLETVATIYRRLVELGAERSWSVVGVGGGVVCDMTGFAASTYMRGVRFGFVPTTLLAQVDASVGGKNGVNFMGYKNIVGLIRQPSFCLFDFDMLRTLPQTDLRCGFAEVVKHAAIGDAELFSYLEGSWEKAFSLNRTAIEKIVHDSLAVKIRIVAADETEKGERMKLNFGHTIGHAIESTAGLPHGEAVSVGMVAAARLSASRGMLGRKDADRLEKLLEGIGLPVSAKIDRERVLDAMMKDKKRRDGSLRMALLEGIGKCNIAEVGMEELEGVVDDLS